MIILDDKTPFERIMKASKKKIQEDEERLVIQEIAEAIGERRVRDLADCISNVESNSGWTSVVEYLSKASRSKYSIPVGLDSINTTVEPLKFREVLFDLFGCTGLDPIEEDTEALLARILDSKSFIDAQKSFRLTVESAARESVSNGSAVFFDIEFFQSNVSDDTKRMIQQAHIHAIQNLELSSHNDAICITPLWYTEYGRLALSELEIKTDRITRNEFDMVLSVLQVSKGVKKKLSSSIDNGNDSFHSSELPNKLYDELLRGIIEFDFNHLQRLGSRHTCSILNYALREYVDDYRITGTSNSYRNLLRVLRNHIAIRWVDSVIPISELTELADDRIVNDAIRILGNFYYEPTITSLLEIFCKSEKQKVRQLALSTIFHLKSRCLETKGIVLKMLNQDCKYLDELRRFYHRTWL